MGWHTRSHEVHISAGTATDDRLAALAKSEGGGGNEAREAVGEVATLTFLGNRLPKFAHKQHLSGSTAPIAA